MTREDKLYSMRMQELVIVAEKLGVKINTKAAKSQAIEKILAAEAKNDDQYVAEIMQQKEDLGIEVAKIDPENNSIEIISETPADLKKEITKPKKGQLIEYNGKSQNICAWAKELGKSANTLYSRLYILGWDVEKAFTK